jgi:hypothetical protein
LNHFWDIPSRYSSNWTTITFVFLFFSEKNREFMRTHFKEFQEMLKYVQDFSCGLVLNIFQQFVLDPGSSFHFPSFFFCLLFVKRPH